MKRCSYCGAKYPDDALLCAVDQHPLEPNNPAPVQPPSGHDIENAGEKPPTFEESPAPKPFDKFAAVFSIIAALVPACFYVFLPWYLMSHGHTRMTGPMLLLFSALGLNIFGMVFGIAALALIKRRQSKGLFASALVGTCLNGLLLGGFIFVSFILPMMARHDYSTTAQGRLQLATQKLAKATNNEKRFYVLDDSAKESFNVGKIDDARKFANELLSLAPEFKSDWNYGNAIQDGNLVLGRIALHEGHVQEAGQYLLAAGASPGSPQMDSFGPNMSLAKDLLEKGQQAVVLKYFGLCRKFWRMDYGKLDEWSNEVKAGKIPEFGANLLY